MSRGPLISFSFFFNDTATTEIYTLSLHDALPIFGPAGDRDLEMRRADDRAHDRQWRAGGLQHRALLDVQLDEGIDIIARRARHFGGVQTELAHRGCDLGIDGVDRARDRVRPPEACLEARALFFTDRDDFERALGLAVGFEQRFDGAESRDDAECAVEPAAVTHRVDV